MENKDPDSLFTTYPMNRCRAGITRGCANNGQGLIALSKYILEQITKQLQSNVLECQGHAMEQLKNIDAILAYHRGNVRVIERGIGTVNQFL